MNARVDPTAPKSLVAQIVDSIKSGDMASISQLIGGNPDQVHYKTPFGFQTWLGYAAGHASIHVVELLLSLGFNVNEGDPLENVKPLACACSKGRFDVAECLLDAGAVMDTATSVQNPLFAAIVGRSPDVVALLLERGIDSTVRYTSVTMHGMDAVAFALMQGERVIAQMISLRNAKGNEVAAAAALGEASIIALANAYGGVDGSNAA